MCQGTQQNTCQHCSQLCKVAAPLPSAGEAMHTCHQSWECNACGDWCMPLEQVLMFVKESLQNCQIAFDEGKIPGKQGLLCSQPHQSKHLARSAVASAVGQQTNHTLHGWAAYFIKTETDGNCTRLHESICMHGQGNAHGTVILQLRYPFKEVCVK